MNHQKTKPTAKFHGGLCLGTPTNSTIWLKEPDKNLLLNKQACKRSEKFVQLNKWSQSLYTE